MKLYFVLQLQFCSSKCLQSICSNICLHCHSVISQYHSGVSAKYADVYYDKQKIKTMWRKICVKHIWFKCIRMFSISVCLNKEQLKCSASSPNFNDSFSLHLTCHIMLVFFVFFLDTSACCRISSLVFFTQPSFKSTLQPAASIFCPPSVWMLLSLIKPRSSLSAHTSFFLTEFCACLWFQFFPDSNSQPFVLI